MTIWHAMQYLAGWPSRTMDRMRDLESMRNCAKESCERGLSASTGELATAWFINHNWYAERYNTRKFWWMRKIKLMSE